MGKFALVVIVFAAIVYTGFWLLERHRIRKSEQGRVPRKVPKGRRVAPDDDEEFLRGINPHRPPGQAPEDPPR